jgi:acyl carrier protein
MTTLDTLQDILVRDYDLDREQLGPDAVLASLRLDSLSLLELMFKIEDNFSLKITGDTPTNLVTVNDVVVYIDGLLAAATPSAILSKPDLAKPDLGNPDLGNPDLAKPGSAKVELAATP